MKEYWKEIFICVIALATAGLAVWFFNCSLKSEKEVSQINLYYAIPADCEAILQINRISSFNYISDQLHPAGKLIPFIYTSLLKNISESSHPLLSFHPRGVLLYGSISEKQRRNIEETFSGSWFPLYSPQKYEKYGFCFVYYPDTAGRFFGYFYRDGLFVAGYSRKLLEEAAKQYACKNITKDIPFKIPQTSISTKFPVNLYFRDKIVFTDSLFTCSDNWVGTDILINEGQFCLSTTFSQELLPEQQKDSIAVIITEKFKTISSSFSNKYQLNKEEESYIYTVCAPIP